MTASPATPARAGRRRSGSDGDHARASRSRRRGRPSRRQLDPAVARPGPGSAAARAAASSPLDRRRPRRHAARVAGVLLRSRLARRIAGGVFERGHLPARAVRPDRPHAARLLDGRGCVNSTVIGEFARPRVRLPGGGGATVLFQVVRRVIVFRTRHDPQSLVPAVDFVTATGNLDRVVTPLGIFRATPAGLRLEAIQAELTLEEVARRTGFAVNPLPGTRAHSAADVGRAGYSPDPRSGPAPRSGLSLNLAGKSRGLPRHRRLVFA